MGANRFHLQFPRMRPLSKDEPASWDGMLQGETAHTDLFIFEDDLTRIEAERMYVQWKTQPRIAVAKSGVQNIANALRSVQVQFLSTVEQMVAGDQPHQTKKMVSVQMADENVIDPLRAELVPLEFGLGALSAVDQKSVLPNIEVLGGGLGIQSGRRTVATQDRQAVCHLIRNDQRATPLVASIRDQKSVVPVFQFAGVQ